MITPREVGLDHPDWRENQLSMYQKVLTQDRNGGGFFVGEMPTGSGKTGVATALGHHRKITAVVHTLALLTQYETKYNFDVIRGRQEYPCVLPAKVQYWKEHYNVAPLASDCIFIPMHKCVEAFKCPYVIAKNRALESQRMACTYRYMGYSGNAKERSGNLVFDEAHDAAEELVRFNKFEILHKTISQYQLPPFPYMTFGKNGKGEVLTHQTSGKVQDWIFRCVKKLFVKDDHQFELDQRVVRKTKMYDRFNRYLTAFNQNDWFLRVDNDGINLMALSAERIAQQIFAHKRTKLLMSATIGDPKPLAKALGIQKYEHATFPHPVPPEYRPIHNSRITRMTRQNLTENPMLYKQQADAIWRWIGQFDPAWRGLIVTTSYFKIRQLEAHLSMHNSRLDKPRRLVVQHQGEKVNDVVNRFITDVQDGDIMIGTIQGMGTGLDLYAGLARWCVVAGVPFSNPSDAYEMARKKMPGGSKYQTWLTFTQIVQASGRISRGGLDENGNYLHNYVLLADGSTVTDRAMKHYPEYFLESIEDLK